MIDLETFYCRVYYWLVEFLFGTSLNYGLVDPVLKVTIIQCPVLKNSLLILYERCPFMVFCLDEGILIFLDDCGLWLASLFLIFTANFYWIGIPACDKILSVVRLIIIGNMWFFSCIDCSFGISIWWKNGASISGVMFDDCILIIFGTFFRGLCGKGILEELMTAIIWLLRLSTLKCINVVSLHRHLGS